MGLMCMGRHPISKMTLKVNGDVVTVVIDTFLLTSFLFSFVI